MRKLMRYLKPFILGLIAAIVLLFAQALCDLNLPNYMSDIVNIGIQQNGIEHIAPDAISYDGMKMITGFMTETEKKCVYENYTLVSISDKNSDGEAYEKIYPRGKERLYVRNEIQKERLAQMDKLFGLATSTFMQSMKGILPLPKGENVKQPDFAMGNLDVASLYSMQSAIEKLSDSDRLKARQLAHSTDASIVKQGGILFTKAFYKELGVDLQRTQRAYILRIGIIMILFALLGGGSTVLVSFLSSKIATGVARNLRKDVFNKIESFSNREFDTFGTASLITRCTNDITQMQQLLQIGIRMICYAPIMGMGGVIMAVNKSASMSWILGVAVIVIVGMIMVLISVVIPKFKIMQRLVDQLNLVARENLSGLMVIRAFGTQRYEKKRFEAANDDVTRTNLYVNRMMAVMIPLMMIIMNGLSLLIIWVGAHQIATSTMQVGDMMAYMQYAMQVLMSFMMLSVMFIMVPRAAVSATRISEVLEAEISITDPKTVKPFKSDKKGIVEFKNVCFRYNGAEVDALSDITFTAKPGQTTAIIGSTGSGKSTIASLVLRLYDVSSGQILIDGVDVREVKQKDLREKIGYVPQKGILLSGTVAFNLKYGKKDATEHELEKVANIAQAMEFIDERPEGFDSFISQGGGNVSGGQKQRLSIARALARKPEILVFDDSFSALDFKTDAVLRKKLKESTGDSTVIIVAQRISSIMNAEQILVLDKGRIVGRGTHRELLENCKEYGEIAMSQMGEGELA